MSQCSSSQRARVRKKFATNLGKASIPTRLRMRSNNVRQALCVMNENIQAPSEQQQENKQQTEQSQQISKNLGGGGKMTRQIGRTNLLMESRMPRTFSPKVMSNDENFEVFVDNENQDNNMIHELDQKMDHAQKLSDVQAQIQENRKQFSIAREISGTLSVYDEGSTAPSVMGFNDDDDFDRCSVISSATTSIRAEFSQINVKVGETRTKSPTKNPFRDSDVDLKYAQTLAEKERKLDEMLMCDAYFVDIFRFMTDRGTKVRASSKYMQKQTEITIEMREILIDWFNDVVIEYGLQQETLHLAVSLVDRVLSRFCVEKHRLQLVGTTALMIASKYEEIYPPELRDFAEITDSTCKTDHILMMERYLLSQLDFVISAPTISWFATCLAKRNQVKKRTRHLIEYLADLAMLGYEFLKFRPSHIAAACLCFANVVLGETEIWSAKLAQETDIRLNGFVVILPHLYKAFTNAEHSETRSIFNKYSDDVYENVAQLPAPTNVYVIPYDLLMSNCPEMLERLDRLPSI